MQNGPEFTLPAGYPVADTPLHRRRSEGRRPSGIRALMRLSRTLGSSPDKVEKNSNYLILKNDCYSGEIIELWGAMLGYDVLGPYVKTQGAIPAAIDRWDAFITAVLDGTNFDYYPDAFAVSFTTYVLESKEWKPRLQIRGANRFYEFKLRLREFV